MTNDLEDGAIRSRPVFARHAASLLVLRNGLDGPEVLMGQRGAGHRFMPNRLVFPGGAVDPDDATLPAATEPRPGVLAMLACNARPRLARALVAAAARPFSLAQGGWVRARATQDGHAAAAGRGGVPVPGRHAAF